MRVTEKNASTVYKALKESFGVDEFLVYPELKDIIALKYGLFWQVMHGFNAVIFTWLSNVSSNVKRSIYRFDLWAEVLGIPYSKVCAEFCKTMLKAMKEHGPLTIGDCITVSYEQFMIDFDLRCSSRKSLES